MHRPIRSCSPISRRHFLTGSLACGGALLLGPRIFAAGGRARVVSCGDARLRSGVGLDPDRVLKLLDETMRTLTGTDAPFEAWHSLFSPDEIIGLKVNCLAGAGLSTSTALVDAICHRLQGIGVPAQSIVVWDRLNDDLDGAGFPIVTHGGGVRRIGNDALGFTRRLSTFGEAGSLLCRTLTEVCDAVINLPVLKDHSITGVTGALKNLFGAIHNPNKYHLGTGDPYVADVYRLGPIRSKVRLHICDATTAQYEGGPSFLAHWAWPCNRLLASFDPVALDRTCWRMIETKRAAEGLVSLTEAKRRPTWIETAADAKHGLGICDPARIDLVERELA